MSQEVSKKTRKIYGAGTINFCRQNGLAATIRALLYRYRSYKNDKRLKRLDTESVFSEIFRNGEWGKWGRDESVSGPGSSLESTKNIRMHLPKIFKLFKIRSIIDAPCGDFNWMRAVPLDTNVLYTGIDIVPALVRNNKEKYGTEQYSFICSNIIKDGIPPGDLLICRDCLFHFSYSDIISALSNFCNADIKYILTSTHLNNSSFENRDIVTGGFRLIDLFSTPFCLPSDVMYRVEDYVSPFPPREMCLWTTDQVKSALRHASRSYSRTSPFQIQAASTLP